MLKVLRRLPGPLQKQIMIRLGLGMGFLILLVALMITVRERRDTRRQKWSLTRTRTSLIKTAAQWQRNLKSRFTVAVAKIARPRIRRNI